MKTDSELKHDVEQELMWEPRVNEAHIGVSAKDGVVTLTGHVPAYAEKYGAERATKRVSGVKAVADELDVKLPGSSKRTDEDIAAACVVALKAHYAVPDQKIKVVVRNAWVIIEGEVEWQYQKEAIENAIGTLTGVKGLTDNITVKTHVSTKDLKEKIEAAFKRSAEIDAQGVSVEAHDGKVTLKGCVRSWVECDEAEQAAWAAPGVTSVDNAIIVKP